MALNQIAYDIALLGNRTGLGNKQLYSIKEIISRTNKDKLKEYISKQSSRNILKSTFVKSFFIAIEDKSKEQIHTIISKVIDIFDFLKIEPFIKKYDDFKKLLENQFEIEILNLEIFVDNGNRKFEFLLKKNIRLDYRVLGDFIEKYYEKELIQRLGINEPFYLCSPNERPRNYFEINSYKT